MNIRLLQKEDEIIVQGIMAGHPLEFPSFGIDRYPPRWEQFLQGDDRCVYYVAASEAGETIGHAGFLFNEALGLYEIVGVVVSKNHQRLGIGKTLIQTICNTLQEIGSKQVILYTLGHIGTENTLSFYRNIGFEMINYEKDYFTADYHRVTFVKEIEQTI
ncbi:GNAT family N-acetyltransferase [Paenibacillus sp. GSMTC-2017]|uniref:GNAT family N-acetyltransferase n=1 Tax=Paenibacillus sp. GSMTC-2017 TaxID=2794350 RepID=UPI0018D86D1D|nr:GNAT family N-acetyltransferase [Paenibacillus sp. GSMTC-2017]MBH5320357.1 GNAT family N-acetyltransferase [Paenibacillus sp. GSMTC-2017]